MELPQGIDSKFRFILVAAKRAHQLHAGARARVQSESNKVTVVAQREVCSGLVPFEVFAALGKPHEGFAENWQAQRDLAANFSRKNA